MPDQKPDSDAGPTHT